MVSRGLGLVPFARDIPESVGRGGVVTEREHQAGDWVPHDSTKPPPALGADFEVEAVVCEPVCRGSDIWRVEERRGIVHEIPWDRVTAWRLP